MIMIKWSFCKCISLTQKLSIACCCSLAVSAQKIPAIPIDSSGIMRQNEILYYKSQRDLVDIALLILHKNPNMRVDSNGIKAKKLRISAGPILEYTLSTGFTSGIAAGGAFLTDGNGQTNTSSILAAVKYTQKKQFLVPIQSSIWTPFNEYNLLGDWRFLNYPQD